MPRSAWSRRWRIRYVCQGRECRAHRRHADAGATFARWSRSGSVERYVPLGYSASSGTTMRCRAVFSITSPAAKRIYLDPNVLPLRGQACLPGGRCGLDRLVGWLPSLVCTLGGRACGGGCRHEADDALASRWRLSPCARCLGARCVRLPPLRASGDGGCRSRAPARAPWLRGGFSGGMKIAIHCVCTERDCGPGSFDTSRASEMDARCPEPPLSTGAGAAVRYLAWSVDRPSSAPARGGCGEAAADSGLVGDLT
jgi:hypothetical protein